MTPLTIPLVTASAVTLIGAGLLTALGSGYVLVRALWTRFKE